MKKGQLNRLKNQIQKAIKHKEYSKVALLMERYKFNGGKLK